MSLCQNLDICLKRNVNQNILYVKFNATNLDFKIQVHVTSKNDNF